MVSQENLPELLKNPILPLASIFLLTILVAYLLAWFYRNDYDPMKMINAYLIYSLPLFLLGLHTCEDNINIWNIYIGNDYFDFSKSALL